MGPLLRLMNSVRQLNNCWRQHSLQHISFSETVHILPQRSYGAHTLQHYDMFRPRAWDRSQPLVVLVPGDYFVATPITALNAHIQCLTAAGYAVAVVYYRLAPEHLYPVQLRDLSIALRSLQSQQRALNGNSTLFLYGFNSGANLVLSYLNATYHHYLAEAFQLQLDVRRDHIHGCALSNGLYNFEHPPLSQRSWSASINRLFLGWQDTHAIRALASPAQHLSPEQPPLLITTGDRKLEHQHQNLISGLDQLDVQYLQSDTDQPEKALDFFNGIREHTTLRRPFRIKTA